MSEEKFGYEDFLSPFTWRYGSSEMREIFSEINYRTLWRKVWVSLAEAQSEYGLVSEEELESLKSKASSEHIDIDRAHEIEEKIGHDLMAEVKTYAEQCPQGGGKIHLGATSMDIEDNADVIRMKNAFDLVLEKLVNCLDLSSEYVEEHKDMPCMGWTHIQPAEPTTLGYRFANYAQDLVLDILAVENLLEKFLKGKGIKGAVGTSASYQRILGEDESPAEMEKKVMDKLDLDYFPVSTQTYPRKLDFLVLSTLSSIAQSVHKFALDLRHLQSPPYGEISEPLKEEQVGSSAMPFKKNPVTAERMCSLARYVSTLPKIAWENSAQSILERTLDDSANRRLIIPESFLAIDEILNQYQKILRGLKVYPEMIERNLQKFGKFSGTEAVLMKLVEKGRDRQEIHEKLRILSSQAWEEVMKGNDNPLPQLLKEDEIIGNELTDEEIDELLESSKHVGDAPKRCENFLENTVEPILSRYEGKR